MINEKDIAEGCLKGNNIARKQLYTEYSGKLLAIGIRYLSNKETAEDVLHDVFIHIFKSFDKFKYRGTGSLFAWISRIMVNASLEYLRKNNRVELTEFDLTDNDMADDDELLDDIPPNELFKMVSELPDGYRTVFNLYVFEDKSHKEIAEMLGINEKSSSSQFFRAKKLLQKKINDYLQKR